jgi:trans-aconitate methyltransferase
MEKTDKRLEHKKAQVKCLIPHAKPGRIVEFGCGSGFVLETLPTDLPESIIIGIDKSMERPPGGGELYESG